MKKEKEKDRSLIVDMTPEELDRVGGAASLFEAIAGGVVGWMGFKAVDGLLANGGGGGFEGGSLWQMEGYGGGGGGYYQYMLN